ncbi:MAG: hypothetical protein AAF085_13875, partial [Planctomycetota bacterium]
MPASAPPNTFYLIDGFAQMFRSYFAIRGGMTSPVTGEPTKAIFEQKNPRARAYHCFKHSGISEIERNSQLMLVSE